MQEIKKNGGVLKSTGKPVPLPLLAAIPIGIGAAFFFNRPGTTSTDTPVPIGLNTDEGRRLRGDTRDYEASKWTKAVDLPWMNSDDEAAEEEEAEAEAEEQSEAETE